jgi:hypothetical protein
LAAGSIINPRNNSYSFSGTDHYLHVKVTAGDGGGDYTVYVIAVTVDTPARPKIDTSTTLDGQTIQFNGAQSGDTAANAVEGVVRVDNVAALLGSYTETTGTPALVLNRGATPTDAEFEGSSLNVIDSLNFRTGGSTLWIRLRITEGTTVLSRYYKVRVILPATDLADTDLELGTEDVYLYTGGAGTRADPILGAVTVSSGTYNLSSSYGGGIGVLESAATPAIDAITDPISTNFTINKATTLWVRIQAFENDAGGDPVYKIYKIAVTLK